MQHAPLPNCDLKAQLAEQIYQTAKVKTSGNAGGLKKPWEGILQTQSPEQVCNCIAFSDIPLRGVLSASIRVDVLF